MYFQSPYRFVSCKISIIIFLRLLITTIHLKKVKTGAGLKYRYRASSILAQGGGELLKLICIREMILNEFYSSVFQ